MPGSSCSPDSYHAHNRQKRMKLKDAGLPQQIMDQTSKFMRRAKLPIVKAKVGPRVMSLIADEQIFDEIPVKKEVKASVSGIYITSVRGIRGPLEKPAKKKRVPCKNAGKLQQGKCPSQRRTGCR